MRTDDSLTLLTRINLDDLVVSFGWQKSKVLAAALRFIFRKPAEKFARWMLDFDHHVGRETLPAAAEAMLRKTVAGLRVEGSENLPAAGPTLFLSNHPGMTDTLCLFAAIGRPDLRIIALDRPFLQALPSVSAHLFYVSDHPADRMRAVRQGTGHLRSGGALLTFPAGKIEPDAVVYPGALQSLQTWTDSAGVFARFVPETRVVPVLVRGVLWQRAVKHPLTRLKPAGPEREKFGAALQLLAQVLFDLKPVTPLVRFGHPILASELGSRDPAVLHAAVLAEMERLLAQEDRNENK